MVNYDLLIRNGCIVNHDHTFYGDVLVKDGKVVDVGKNISDQKVAHNVIDATGLHVLPGLIDSHVHINEPGRTDWEGFETGSRGLAAGGASTFFDMPLNSIPPVTTSQGFLAKKKLADEKSVIDYRLWGGLVPTNIHLLEELDQLGVIGFKAFMSNSGVLEFSAADDSTLIQGMTKIAEIDSILAVHAESDAITSELAIKLQENGRVSTRDYCASRPIISEIEAVQRLLTYAELTGCKVHICHVSSGDVIKKITEAKQRGIDVTVETCPHYLAFNIDDFEEIGTLAKCAPPIREQQHVESLWKSLIDGEIDTIGSDHSPSPLSLKEAGSNDDMFKAWGGIAGAQMTLNVLLEEGYQRRNFSLESIVRLTTANPAKRFGLYPKKGVISPGSDADITIVDLNESFTLGKHNLFQKHKDNPYVGRKFRGKILTTFVRGNAIFSKGEIADHLSSKQNV